MKLSHPSHAKDAESSSASSELAGDAVERSVVELERLGAPLLSFAFATDADCKAGHKCFELSLIGPDGMPASQNAKTCFDPKTQR